VHTCGTSAIHPYTAIIFLNVTFNIINIILFTLFRIKFNQIHFLFFYIIRQRVIDKGPHSFDNKAITVERQYIEEETNYRGYDKCTIEVTGMNQATTPFNITVFEM
jgi:Na+/phosphate symporter